MAQHCFAEKPYVTLEDPDTRDFALHDPRSFLAQFPDGAILDEVQRCSDLFSYAAVVAQFQQASAVEVKSGQTLSQDQFKGLLVWLIV